jgi:toxin ParE1/3/4
MWKLSAAAISDLEVMAEWGGAAFGLRVAEDYQLHVLDLFDDLAAHPEMGVERFVAGQMIRLMPYRSHHVIYRIDDGDVIIVRVLHHLQSLPDKLLF